MSYMIQIFSHQTQKQNTLKIKPDVKHVLDVYFKAAFSANSDTPDESYSHESTVVCLFCKTPSYACTVKARATAKLQIDWKELLTNDFHNVLHQISYTVAGWEQFGTQHRRANLETQSAHPFFF